MHMLYYQSLKNNNFVIVIIVKDKPIEKTSLNEQEKIRIHSKFLPQYVHNINIKLFIGGRTVFQISPPSLQFNQAIS